jgi:hypothetical protein
MAQGCRNVQPQQVGSYLGYTPAAALLADGCDPVLGSFRWLRGTEFHFPERPENLPSLKPLENWPKFNPRNLR